MKGAANSNIAGKSGSEGEQAAGDPPSPRLRRADGRQGTGGDGQGIEDGGQETGGGADSREPMLWLSPVSCSPSPDSGGVAAAALSPVTCRLSPVSPLVSLSTVTCLLSPASGLSTVTC